MCTPFDANQVAISFEHLIALLTALLRIAPHVDRAVQIQLPAMRKRDKSASAREMRWEIVESPPRGDLRDAPHDDGD